jgi:hypothetical protein
MGSRGFGRACLADVRRRLARYVLDAAAVPDADPVRALLVCREPEILAVWEAPPQPRTLESVVDEILALLARGEQLRAAGGGRRPLRNGGLPVAVDFGHATLPEVAAFVLAGLRPREREVLELRFSGTDGEGPSLSTLGKRFGLTRERVRQIGAAALSRLGRDTEVQRRKPLTDDLLERFRAGGGVLREMAVVTCLRDRYPGPRGLALPLHECCWPPPRPSSAWPGPCGAARR